MTKRKNMFTAGPLIRVDVHIKLRVSLLKYYTCNVTIMLRVNGVLRTIVLFNYKFITVEK